MRVKKQIERVREMMCKYVGVRAMCVICVIVCMCVCVYVCVCVYIRSNQRPQHRHHDKGTIEIQKVSKTFGQRTPSTQTRVHSQAVIEGIPFWYTHTNTHTHTHIHTLHTHVLMFCF